MLTDGIISDMAQTKEAIVNVSLFQIKLYLDNPAISLHC